MTEFHRPKSLYLSDWLVSQTSSLFCYHGNCLYSKMKSFFFAKKGEISLLPLLPFGSFHLRFADTWTHPLSQVSMKKRGQSSYNIVIGDVNVETVAFLLNRVRLCKRLGHVHGANVSGFSHLLCLHCQRSRSKGTISSLFSCNNGPTAQGGRVVPRHLRDLLWKGGVTVSKSPLLKTEERRPLQLTKKK